MSSDSENEQCTPPDIRKIAGSVVAGLLPTKSKAIYESAYNAYSEWKKSRNVNATSESTLLVYFDELSKKYKSTTLWSLHSKLKSTIKIKEKVDIDKYKALSAFMHSHSRGHINKQAYVLTTEELNTFLTTAPDIKYLAAKGASHPEPPTEAPR
ncbi:uncharacterized protein LOC127279910 [Leptopilina boulardi]|uniref:uncharacterized protein LOC127279910 n=1 Tax=Leptopilina boulardi TaxID=63433 RepID=UPI0021F5D2B3|nr:uncharacterized protein LOC127279910 [Leptopilina boulardi]